MNVTNVLNARWEAAQILRLTHLLRNFAEEYRLAMTQKKRSQKGVGSAIARKCKNFDFYLDLNL
jgi:hypothetical protein